MRLASGLAFAVLLPLASAMPAAAQSGEGSLTLHLEPGVVTGPGEAIVPFRLVDRQGRGLPARAGEITVEVEGRSVPNPRIVSFLDAEPYALFVLVDPAAMRGADVAAWAAELEAIWNTPAPGEHRVLMGIDRGVDEWLGSNDVPEPEQLVDRLTPDREVALWDGVLLALDRVSRGQLPARRVLLVVANGREGRESRHPVATCVDAADSARVSVWCVTPGAPQEEGVGVERLRSLSSRTGGATVVATQGGGVDALREVLAGIRGSQAVRLHGIDGVPPFTVTLRPGVAAARPVAGFIRKRRALGLSGGGDFPWLPLAAGLIMAGVAVGLVARRRIPIGSLTPLSGEGGVVPVTRRGLTIGGARGNGLVLLDSRVSRNHAEIRIEEGRVILVDLRSSNGTKVNGQRVRSAKLVDGDRIVVAEAVELKWRAGFRFGRGG